MRIGLCIALVWILSEFLAHRPSSNIGSPRELSPPATRPTTRPSDGVVVQRITQDRIALTVVRVDLTASTLRLHWKDQSDERYGSFGRLQSHLEEQGQQLLFAANAGIFTPEFTPCGLHVEDGRELVPLNLRDGPGNFHLKPNGVFLIDGSGAQIIDATKYGGTRAGIRLAMQSGPLLVIDGKIHPAFVPGSTNKRTRSGVGVSSARQVVFALSEEPVTFHAFATLFRDRLDCPNALYLDGVISQFCIPPTVPRPVSGYAALLAATRGK